MGSEINKEGLNVSDSKFKQEIYSKIIRAGKRTYFFDVKSTRKDEYYLTITESKKHFNENGKHSYEKHKLFLYKEDFSRFVDGLLDVVDYIKEKQPDEPLPDKNEAIEEGKEEELIAATEGKDYTNIEFDDI